MMEVELPQNSKESLCECRPRLQRLSKGIPYFEVRLKEAVALGLITPPTKTERKVEDPPRSRGKPLSYYLNEIRS